MPVMLLLERAHKVLPERNKQEQSSSADMASLGTTETSLGSVPSHSDTVTGTSDGFSDNAEFIKDTMRRLAPHAPSAGSDKTIELLSVFLSKDHPVVESEARADIIAELDSDARAFKQSMEALTGYTIGWLALERSEEPSTHISLWCP